MSTSFLVGIALGAWSALAAIFVLDLRRSTRAMKVLSTPSKLTAEQKIKAALLIAFIVGDTSNLKGVSFASDLIAWASWLPILRHLPLCSHVIEWYIEFCASVFDEAGLHGLDLHVEHWSRGHTTASKPSDGTYADFRARKN